MSILDKIVETKKSEIEELKKTYSKNVFEAMENFYDANFDFKSHLVKENDVAIIAEIKKASPSKGVIKENFNHIEIAKEYFEANVDTISILTDEKYFMGSIIYLRDIAKFKQKPLLRKDFIVDEIQIYQAKAYGADAILLICEILTKEQIYDFTKIAKSLGMSVLLELHNIEQLDKIDFSINDIIGVNNRDLNTFVTNLDTCGDIFKILPKDVVKVAESGIFTNDDVKKVYNYGANAILVGEAIMRESNIKAKINELRLK